MTTTRKDIGRWCHHRPYGPQEPPCPSCFPAHEGAIPEVHYPSADEFLDKYSINVTDNQDLSKGGVKYDTGKPRMDLLAPEAIEGLASVLDYGAKKYADRNWERGMRWGRCTAAALRHIFAWMRGEDRDPETGLSHIDHAMCCLMFLKAYIARKVGEDDRKRIFDESAE